MIAYFILVHRFPQQFKRLFAAIYSPENYYLIHVDKKADPALYKNIELFLLRFPNASLLESQNVVWGGYSMVDVELNGIKELLRLDVKWDFYINLSGQDFPLKSQASIEYFLRKNMTSSFIKMVDQVKKRPITLNRIQNYFQETASGFLGTPTKRSFLPNVTPYIGGQWKILTRSCCEFICSSPKVGKFRKFYRHTLIADESFFQTVLMNTNYKGKLVNDDKRAIIWIPDIALKDHSLSITGETTKELVASGKVKLRPKIFTMKDLKFLSTSTAFFARKFDENVDAEIFGELEAALLEPVAIVKNSKMARFETAAVVSI